MKTVGLIGFGVSNRALYEHFARKDCKITVHNESKIPLPSGTQGVFGQDYLTCNEDLVFRSPGVKPQLIKSKTRPICESEYALTELDVRTICISGSDGKTTTATLIHRILSQKYSAFLGGNIGTPITYALDGDYDFAVCELSSFQLCDFAPKCDCAVLTCITPNHLDWHADMSEYISAKENVLKNARRRVLCYDDPILRELGAKYGGITWFTLKEPPVKRGFAYVKDGYIYYENERIMPCGSIRLRGEHNLKNALAAICVCAPYVDKSVMAEAVCTFEGVENRLELVKTVGGVSYFNSSIDTTPSRTLASLSAFDKKRTVLILGGYNKNLSFEPFIGALDTLLCAIVLGSAKDEILPCLRTKAYTVNTLSEAVLLASKIARNGDSVLLSPACASFDTYKSYKERALDFIYHVRALEDK